MSFHSRLVNRTPTEGRLPIQPLSASIELYSLIGQPAVTAIETEFGLDPADAEWIQFKTLYAGATDKTLFLAIALNVMRLAEGGYFGMDDSTTFFSRLTSATSGV